MSIPIACPACGATYAEIKLAPGSAFACGQCGHALRVPGASTVAETASAPPVIMPTRPGPEQPRVAPQTNGPVVPKPAGARPTPASGAPARPVVKPAAPARQVVKPAGTARPASRPGAGPRPAAAPRSPASSAPRAAVTPVAPAKPAPVVKPVAPPVRPMADPAGDEAAEASPPVRPARSSRAPRRTPTRSKAAAPGRDSRRPGSRPGSSKVPMIVAGGFLGLAAVVALIVVIASSGLSDEEVRDSYVAGYVAACKARLEQTFLQTSPSEQQRFEAFKGSYGGEASYQDFVRGCEDGRRLASPAEGAELIGPALFDVNAALAMAQESSAKVPDDVHHQWRLAEQMATLAEMWQQQQAPAPAVQKLEAKRKELLQKVTALDPGHAQARAELGEIVYDDGKLSPFLTAEYLSSDQRAKARKLHDQLTAMASSRGGYVPATELKAVETLVIEFQPLLAAYEKLAATPFYQAANELKEKTTEDLQVILGDAKKNFDKIATDEFLDAVGIDRKELEESWLKGVADRKFVPVIREPYVVFVEDDPGWKPKQIAEQEVLERLIPLNNTFLAAYQKKFDLPAMDKPIPVVLFRGKIPYLQYHLGKNASWPAQVEAHFEHDTGRLVVPADADWTTMLHEGTHQLFHFYRKNRPEFNAQSFWFEEGVAEWFSGALRLPDGKGGWVYQLGLLQERRIKGVSGLIRSSRHMKLNELLGATYASRAAWGATAPQKIFLTYAQGWMFIYFLNYFDVNEEGYVTIDTPEKPVVGKYREVWERYLAYELLGKDDKPFTGREAFKQVLRELYNDDQAILDKIANEFEAYQLFILNKLDLGHVKDKRLLPWDQAKNSAGKVIGEKRDDLLSPGGAGEKPSEGEGSR